jgi:ribosome-associated toxin RatA of RatAB toxin-antitoxin module
MRTRIERRAHADPRIAFELAAAVEDWPRILPHYRWVRVLEQLSANRRVVEMAARRDVIAVPRLSVPLRWTAIQTLHPHAPRIEFEHVAGVTRGMQVAWTFQPQPHALQIAIEHDFTPRWPVSDVLVHLIIGEYFVNGVAARTLRRIAELAEARTRALQARVP